MFENLPLWPVRASSTAGSVDALYIFLLTLCGVMCIGIFTMIAVFAIRYRRSAGNRAEAIEGSTALELTGAARLKAGDKSGALEVYKTLADDLAAPQGMRARAAEMAAALSS